MATTNIQSFSGDVQITGGLTVTGTVASTTGVDKVKLAATTSSETDYVPLSKGATGSQALYTDANLTYNPSTNQLSANLSGNVSGNVTGNLTGNVTGNVSGSAASATNATFATNSTHSNAANTVAFTARNATNDTDYIAFVDTSTAGDKALFTDTNLTYNSSTGQITANLSGNVTGNVSGSAGSATNATFATSATNATYANSAGSATNATFATNSTHSNNANTVAFTARNATNDADYIAFVDSSAAGDKALYTDSNLTYNSSTNAIGANLTGNVTGNVSGNAAYATNAGYANNSGNLGGRAYSEGANASTIVSRDSAADINCRLVRPNYANQTSISGAIAYRVNNSTDNYVRFCSDAGAIRTFLTVPTRTGGDASGTWSISVNGNAAYATNAGFATNSTHSNNANTVAFTARNATNNTDYIAFVDTSTAGDKALFVDSNLTYNSSSNYINANVPYANAAGSATNATYAASSTNATYAGSAAYATSAGTAGRTTNSGTSVRIASGLIHTRNYYYYSGNRTIDETLIGYSPLLAGTRKIIEWSIQYSGSYDQVFRVLRRYGTSGGWTLIGYNSATTDIYSGVSAIDGTGGSNIITKTIRWMDDDNNTTYRQYILQAQDTYTGSWNREFAINRCTGSWGQTEYEIGVTSFVITEYIL